MKTSRVIQLVALAVIIGVSSVGCCSIAGKWSNKDNNKWDPGCHLLGNVLFGGPIGIVIDILTNAAWESDSSGWGVAPDNHSDRMLAVHLNDGRVIVLRDLPPTMKINEQLKRTHLPEKFIVKTEWVVAESTESN